MSLPKCHINYENTKNYFSDKTEILNKIPHSENNAKNTYQKFISPIKTNTFIFALLLFFSSEK